jgi:hypothetical protein
MNELVYVLAVEALVFGALCTVVLAQRLDVLHWPADRTWPVLASAVQVLLLNAHYLKKHSLSNTHSLSSNE